MIFDMKLHGIVIQSVVHTHWLTVHSVLWAESWPVFGQFVVVPLPKNIKCSSPPNHVCLNECLKPQTLKECVQDSNMWFLRRFQDVIFFFMVHGLVMEKKHSFEQTWFGGDEHFIFLDKGTTTNWPQTVQLSAQWTLWTVSQCVCITLCHRGFTDLSITKGKTEKTNSQDNEIHFNSKFMSRAESQKQKGSSRLQTGWTGTHWNAGRRGCCCFP